MPAIIATEKDFEGIKEIWEEHFTTDQEYLSIIFGEIIPRCTNYVYKVGEKVVSILSLMPMKFIDSSNNKPLNGWYMFGVATHKEYWGKRLAAETIKTASEELEEKGYKFIFERPANQSLNQYYLNLGFSKQLGYIPYQFKGLEHGSTRNIESKANQIVGEISNSFTKRFEWENLEILKGLIKLGEVEFNNTIYAKTPPEGVFIAIKPLGNTQPEIFNNTFFCFPME